MILVTYVYKPVPTIEITIYKTLAIICNMFFNTFLSLIFTNYVGLPIVPKQSLIFMLVFFTNELTLLIYVLPTPQLILPVLSLVFKSNHNHDQINPEEPFVRLALYFPSLFHKTVGFYNYAQ